MKKEKLLKAELQGAVNCDRTTHAYEILHVCTFSIRETLQQSSLSSNETHMHNS